MDTIAPDLWRGVLEQLDRIDANGLRMEATALRTEAKMEQLLARFEASEQASVARQSNVDPKEIIALMQRVSAEVSDWDTAFRELVRLVETAINVQADGRGGSNLGEFVDEVLRRVAERSAQGDYVAASAEIEAALQQEKAESKARTLRLLDSGVKLDILQRQPASAVRRLLAKINLEAGEGFEGLRALRSEAITWMDRGREKGLNLDLEVAIGLLEVLVDRSINVDLRRAALNDLGVALMTLGGREIDTNRLRAAERALRAAAGDPKNPIRDDFWKDAIENLGSTLCQICEREWDDDLSKEAIWCFRMALKGRDRLVFPASWAQGQSNLAGAFKFRGAAGGRAIYFKKAICRYRVALEFQSRGSCPNDWAMTKSNLAACLLALASIEHNLDYLDQAISCCNEALLERTEKNQPIYWATTVANKGLALLLKAEMCSSIEPRRVCRRLIVFSYAAMGSVSRAA